MSARYKSDTKTENELREPKQFAVIMYNDDYTTMEFVVDILVRIFHKSSQEAAEIMMTVHQKGSAVAGIYTYDIAVTKKNQTDLISNEKGFPLKMSVCEVSE